MTWTPDHSTPPNLDAAATGLRSRSAGFSLPELLVALCILAVTTSLAVPHLGRMIENYRLKASSRQLISDLQFAKMRAVGQKLEYRLIFDSASNRYSIEQGDSGVSSARWTQTGIYRNLSDMNNPYFAKGVTFSDTFTNHRVVFSPMGEASETGMTTFSSANFTLNVAVAMTGRVWVN